MAKILVDFDSTLTQLDHHLLATCNARHGSKYTPEDVTHWDWLGECEHADWLWGVECYGSRDWQLSVPAQPGAITVMRAVITEGHEPVIVTDRAESMARLAHEWLCAHGLTLPVVAAHRTMLPKLQVAKELGLELAIEDAPHHALALAAAGIPVYLMDKPYNRAVEHALINRVSGWQEVGEMLGLEMIDEVAA